ncbi:MAG: translocation/assembly module TamB domain-containing protein [Sideroxydans sp.]|nr:translocation/assembly module TamB domain-containing protein [Sideroxydans sp.]
MVVKKTKLSPRKKWMLILLTPCVAAAGVGYYLLGTTSGMRWMAGVADRHTRGALKLDGLSGSVLGGFKFEQLTYDAAGQKVDVHSGEFDWKPSALLSNELHLLRLSVQRIDVHATKSDAPAVMPTSLALPLDVTVDQLQIGQLRYFTNKSTQPDFELSQLEAALHSDQQQHQLKLQHAHLPAGNVMGDALLATAHPFAFTAHLALDTATPREEPLRVLVDAQGDLQRFGLLLNTDGAGLNVQGNVEVAPLAEVAVPHMEIQFKGLEIERLLADMPRARLTGKIELFGKPKGWMEGDIRMHNDIARSIDHSGIPLQNITAQLRVSADHWQIRGLDAQTILQGHLAGTMDWNAKQNGMRAQLNLRAVDVQAFDSRLESRRMNGSVTLDGAGESQHAVLALADGTAKLTGDLTRQGKRVKLNSMRLVRGETSLEGQGEFIMDRRRSFRFVSRLQKLNLAEFAATPPTELNAQVSVAGELLPKVHGELRFDLANSHFAQHEIAGNGRIVLAGEQRGEGEFALHLGDNQLSVSGNYGNGSDHLRMVLTANDLSQFDTLMAGELKGEASLTGTAGAPQFSFSLGGEALQLPSSQRIKSFAAKGEVSSQSLNINLLAQDINTANGLNIPVLEFDVNGAPEQHTVRAHAQLKQDDVAQEDVRLSAQGGVGDLEQSWRAWQWQGMLNELVGTGSLPLQLNAPTTLLVASQIAQLGASEYSAGGGQAKLTISQWTPAYWRSAGSFSGLGVRAINVADSEGNLDRFDTLRFGGNWDVQADDHWDALFNLQRESGDWVVDAKTGTRFGLDSLNVNVRAVKDQLEAQLSATGAKLGVLNVSAKVPLTPENKGWTVAPDAPLTGRLFLNSSDLSWFGPVWDGNFQTGGKLMLDAELIGNLYTPRLKGSVQGEGLSFAMLDQGVRLEQGQLRAQLRQDEVQLDLFDFDSPYLPQPKDKLLGDFKLSRRAGKLTASGTLDLKGDKGGVQITAQQFPLLQRSDRWVIASGTGHAHFSGKTLVLDGDIRADAGLIDQPVSNRPQLAEDVQIVGQEVDDHTQQQNKVAASLALGDHFYIRASGLEARLAGKLDVRGEPGEPLSVTGIIEAQDAVFDAYGQRLQVDRGMVNFQGRMDDPGLNILATRKGLSVEAGVEVTGTARKPVIHLVSTPSVPDAEKLSWIVLGRVPDSSGIDSSLLLSAATNILGGQSALHLGRAIGVDELSLNQKAGGDITSQVVTVGKRLNARAYISYEQGLTSTAGITKFTYTLSPRVTLVTRTGVDDALDLFYSFRYY